MNNLKKINELQHLYDAYSELLTVTQQNYFECYYFEDLSLSEIADNLGVSRTAVHSNLQKTITHLHNYEDKLGLVAKDNSNKIVIEKLKEKYNIIDEDLKDLL